MRPYRINWNHVRAYVRKRIRPAHYSIAVCFALLVASAPFMLGSVAVTGSGLGAYSGLDAGGPVDPCIAWAATRPGLHEAGSCGTTTSPSCAIGDECCVFASNFDDPMELTCAWLVYGSAYMYDTTQNRVSCIEPSYITMDAGFAFQKVATTPGALCKLPDGGHIEAGYTSGMMQAGEDGGMSFFRGTLEIREQLAPSWAGNVLYGVVCQYGAPSGFWGAVYPGNLITACNLWVPYPDGGGVEIDFPELSFVSQYGVNRYINNTSGVFNGTCTGCGGSFFQQTAGSPLYNTMVTSQQTYDMVWLMDGGSTTFIVEGGVAKTFSVGGAPAAGDISPGPQWLESYLTPAGAIYYDGGVQNTIIDYVRVTQP